MPRFHITELTASHEEAASQLLQLSPEQIRSAAPGERWAAVDDDGRVAACCSIWWEGTPLYDDALFSPSPGTPGEGRGEGSVRNRESSSVFDRTLTLTLSRSTGRGDQSQSAGAAAPVGLVGHYAARDPEAGVAVLTHACGRLAAQGRALAVGPMDGSTWRRYRLVTHRGDEPPFFLEPENPDDYPRQFVSAGFAPLAGYTSAVIEPLDADDPRVADASRRLREAGVVIRNFDPARFEDQLRHVYDVSVRAFADNFLYTPISEEEFLAQYSGLRRVLRPELVFLAEDAGTPVGFAFVTPDLSQAARGRPIDTMILKTLARVPGNRYAGLGAVLTARSHEAAQKLGFRRAIHALMHDQNPSQKLSRDRARTIRRYTLYARRLP